MEDEKPKVKKTDEKTNPEKDVFVLRETLYSGKHYRAGSVIKDFDRKLKSYGVEVPVSERGKYERYVFDGEVRYKPKKGGKK